MLSIRMQRTGRRGHAQFRLIAQDSRFHPTRGKVVAYLGSYDPHAKTAILDKEAISKYLTTGAQPSDTAARLLKKEGVKLPDWVKVDAPKKKAIKHPEKLRRNRPAAEPAPEKSAQAAEAAPAPESEAPQPAETSAKTAEESLAPDAPVEQAAAETPAEEPAPATPAEEPAEVDKPADSEPAA